MKKQYQQPDMEVVAINGASQLLDGSPLEKVEGNADMKYGGGGKGPAQSDEYYDMDDDDLDW